MVVAAIAGYFIGSLSFATWVGRLNGKDPRVSGDGNAGWWNTRAVSGDRWATVVLVGDIAKGLAAAVVGSYLWGPWWTAYVAVFFAMVGHAFPAFAGFRGGRSVLTFVGGVLILSPVAAFIAIGIGVATAIGTRKFTYGARVAMFVFPFVQAFFDPITHVALTGVLMTFIGLRFLVARTLAPATNAPA